MSKRLLLLSCSQRKRPDPGLLPAIERYDGPQYQVLRTFIREYPAESQLSDTYILSAKLSQHLRVNVDLVTKSGLKPRIGQSILQEVIYL